MAIVYSSENLGCAWSPEWVKCEAEAAHRSAYTWCSRSGRKGVLTLPLNREAGLKIGIFGLPWGACVLFPSRPLSSKCRACWCCVQKEFGWRLLVLGGSEKGRRGLILPSEMTWLSLVLFGFYDLCTAFIVAVRKRLRGINALIAYSLRNQDRISEAPGHSQRDKESGRETVKALYLVFLGTVSQEEKWGHLRGRKSYWQTLQKKESSCLPVAWLPVSHYQKLICTSQTFVSERVLLFFSQCMLQLMSAVTLMLY